MKVRHTLSLLLFCAAPSAFASNIVWISDGVNDANTPPGLSDQGFVDLLTAAGHSVTRGTAMAATRPTAATLNSADLIILGRSAGSAAFAAGAANAGFWNGLTAPVLSTNPYALRSTQLGWNVAGNIVDQISSTVTFSNPSDPVSAYLIGSTAMTGNTTTNSLTHALTYYNGTVDLRGTSISTDAPVAGGTVIASTLVGAGPATSGFITAWPAGTIPSGANAGQTFGGYRMQFFAGNREAAAAPLTGVNHAGYENLTPDGEAMFLRAVTVAINNGAVPEPGSTALAFAAGALALGRRRRAVRACQAP